MVVRLQREISELLLIYMECVVLSVASEKETRERPVITCDPVLQALMRGTEDAPDLICGRCRRVLTSGISLGRFMTIDDVLSRKVRAFALDAGPLVVDETIKLREGVCVAGLRRPVLKCPSCNALNDTQT